jgi:hypothetical protein
MSLAEHFLATAQPAEPVNTPPVEEVKHAMADPSAVHSALTASELIGTIQTADVLDEVADHSDGIEAITDSIEEANANGGLSVESLAFATLALQYSQNRLGLPTNLIETAGMENLKAGEKMIVSVESLQLSNEGLGSALKDIIKRQGAAWLRANRFLGTQILIHRRKLAALIDLAKDAEGTQAAGNIEIDITRLHKGGSMPSDPATFLTTFFTTANSIVNVWQSKAESAMNANLKSLVNLKTKEPDEFEASLRKLADGWVDPRKFLGANVNIDVPGGFKLFVDRPLQYKGNNASAKKLDQFANLNFPRRMGEGGEKAGTKKASVKPLTREQVSKIAQAAQKLMETADRGVSFIEALQGSATTIIPSLPLAALSLIPPAAFGWTVGTAAGKAVIHTVPKTMASTGWGGLVKKQYRAEIAALRNAVRANVQMCFHVTYDTLSLATAVDNGFIAYAKASLRTYKK